MARSRRHYFEKRNVQLIVIIAYQIERGKF